MDPEHYWFRAATVLAYLKFHLSENHQCFWKHNRSVTVNEIIFKPKKLLVKIVGKLKVAALDAENKSKVIKLGKNEANFLSLSLHHNF